MKKFILFLIAPFFLWAQFQFIPISVDYASFYATDTTSYIEVYISFFQGNLKYQETEEGNFIASFSDIIEITQGDSVIQELTHNYQNSTRDTSQLKKYNLFVDIFNFELPYGNYKTKVQMVDNKSMLKGEYLLDISTITPQDQLYFSDIELCSQIKSDTARTIFYKNSFKVVPNPRRVFDIIQPMLYYYVELNNLPYSDSEPHYYEFQYFITNVDGDTIKKNRPKTKEIFSQRLVEVGGLNVMALPKNMYFLNTKATDLSSGNIASTRRKFFVYKPTKKDTITTESSLPDIAEVYNDFTKEQLIEEFRIAKYIANRKEEKIFKNLENEEAMKKFLTEFWRSRDIKAHFPIGASRLRFMKLVEFSNANFGAMGRPGWRTDRGRVLLIYGEPDDFERFPSSMDVLPYIIWRYHKLEGGAMFIFTDLDGFGEYQLIHSTYRKELQNPNWQSIINKTAGSMIRGEF